MQDELVIVSFTLAPNYKQKFRLPSVAKRFKFDLIGLFFLP